MEETKWLTKTKLIIILAIVFVIAFVTIFIVVRKNNLRKEYKNYEEQLKYSAPNYLLKEKIIIGEEEWREISAKDLLKQGLVSNKRSSDCEGYVIAQGHKNKTTTKKSTKEVEVVEEENEETKEDKEQTKKEEKVASENITYTAYVKCKNIYTTDGYGTKNIEGKENTEETQTENDTEKPKMALFGDKTITLKVGDEYKELKATAVDNVDGDISNKIKITGEVDTTKAGTYEIVYTVKDAAKNKASITRTVIVEEKEVEEKKEEKKEVEKKEEKTSTPSTTTQQTQQQTQTPSQSQNTQPAAQPARDTTAPLIIFNDNNLYQTICNGNRVNTSYNGPYGFVARDNVDGNITSRVSVTGDTGVINTPGVYNLYYRVSDNAGNTAQATRQFTVKNCESTIPNTNLSIPVNNVVVTPNVINAMSIGSTQTLSVSLFGTNGKEPTDKSITWSSSNTSVATVDSNGTVRAVGRGSASIKATSSNGKTGMCRVTVQ